jgi:hypothetical protein
LQAGRNGRGRTGSDCGRSSHRSLTIWLIARVASSRWAAWRPLIWGHAGGSSRDLLVLRFVKCGKRLPNVGSTLSYDLRIAGRKVLRPVGFRRPTGWHRIDRYFLPGSQLDGLPFGGLESGGDHGIFKLLGRFSLILFLFGTAACVGMPGGAFERVGFMWPSY